MDREMTRGAAPHYTIQGGRADAERLARQAADRAGVQVQFLRAEATAPPERDAFDLAYARLVLSHLADPIGALRAMRAAVRPGAAVAIEDLFTGTLRSDPPEPALDRLQELYSATVRFHGGDPTIGPRLRALLAQPDWRRSARTRCPTQ